MRDFVPQLFTIVATALLGVLLTLQVWAFHRQWWTYSGVRTAVWATPLAAIAGSSTWALFHYLDVLWAGRLFALFTVFLFLAILIVNLLLPFSGAALSIERLVKWFRRRRVAARTVPGPEPDDAVASQAGDDFDPSRRSFVALGATAVPALSIGITTSGIAQSTSDATFTPVELVIDNLPPDLDGLKIVQITDLHLGYFIRLHHLESILIGAERFDPDLVLLTGDVSDDLSVLPEALDMISQLKPRLGTIASVGNHEYYRGIREVRGIFDRSEIPLLVNMGSVVKVGGSELYLGAADDPASQRDEFSERDRFMQSTVDAAMSDLPSRATSILLSHRPDAFDVAADSGVDITLAGHTHAGGQMGWNGRSLVETWFGMGKYLWGYYEKNGGRSKLYTSAGAGHWLPFRLGVPREVPVYSLRRGRGSDSVA